jgi:hypothetical protein
MFDKFSTGNFYLREKGTGNTPNREQGMGNGEHGMANATLSLSTSLTDHTKNNQIQSPPLTRGGLGRGQIIFDILIMTFQTTSEPKKSSQ